MTTDVLHRDSAVPLYVQLEEILRAKIVSGEWQPNQRIPSENELNRIYGLSRMTARGVLTKLVNDGLLFRVPGKGTYVAPMKISAISPAYRGMREQLEAMGFETTTQVLHAGLEQPSGTVRERLQLGAGQDVYAIHRLRSVRGEPISLHHSYVPSHLAPGLDARDTAGEQLCVVLERDYGLGMRRVTEHLEATSARRDHGDLLGISVGAPVLRLEDVISDARGLVFEYSEILFRGDKIRIGFDYEL
jgi:GntR family transcriptional regulator